MSNITSSSPCTPCATGGGYSSDIFTTTSGVLSYTLTDMPDSNFAVQVFRNGQLQLEGAPINGYTLSGATLTITAVVFQDEEIQVFYVPQ